MTASALLVFAHALLAVAGFVAVLFAGSRVVPGRAVAGGVIEDGRPRRYRLNGLALFLASTAIALATALAGLGWASWLHAHAVALLAAANVFALLLIGALYLRGRAHAAASPRALRDAFLGLERNPAWWGVDLKLFSYRPSLIGLALINLSFALVQYQRLGLVSQPMVLYQAFTFLYVLNYFQFEHGMLHTWDIVAERFGGMLVWGDFVLVPFFYSLPGWFVLDRVQPLGAGESVALIALFALGFWLFRGANEQKHRFKQDPRARIWGRPAQALEGRLLVSGFWGIGRHLNYTGEIGVYLAFTLCAGFHSAVPWLLPAWLAALLAHRAWRDERRCRAKYGALWDAYTRRARFRMIPFIY